MLRYCFLFCLPLLYGCYSNPVTVQEFRKLEAKRFPKQDYPIYNLGLKDGRIHVEAYGRIYQFKPEDLPFAQKYRFSKEPLYQKQDLTDQLRPDFLKYFDLDPDAS